MLDLGTLRGWAPDYWRGMGCRLWIAHWIRQREEDELRRRANEDADRRARGEITPEEAKADPRFAKPPPADVLRLLPTA